MVGSGPSNHFSTRVNFDQKQHGAFSWEIRSNITALKVINFAKGALFAMESGRVRSYSIYDGTIRWEYLAQGQPYGTLATMLDACCLERNDVMTLVALSASTGKEQYAQALMGEQFSSIIVSGGVMVPSALFSVFKATTGALLWRLEFDSDMILSGSTEQHVVAVHGNQQLYLLDAKTGDMFGRNFWLTGSSDSDDCRHVGVATT